MTATSAPPVRRDLEVSVAGRVLRYREWGAAEAPTVLLLHGLVGNSREWDTVAAALARTRRVVVPDQRGHGASDWAGSYTADDLVGDVADLVAVLGLDGFDLVGHSMGGIVALLYTDRSARPRRLAMLDIGPESLEDQEARAGFLAMLQVAATSDFSGPDEATAEWLAGDPFAREAEVARWARHALRQRVDGRWAWRYDARGVGDFLARRPPAERLWAALGRVAVPTLVVRGEHSPMLDPATAAAMAAGLSHGHLTEIPGAAHDLGVQQPEAVARVLDSFLRQSPAPARSAGRR